MSPSISLLSSILMPQVLVYILEQETPNARYRKRFVRHIPDTTKLFLEISVAVTRMSTTDDGLVGKVHIPAPIPMLHCL